MSQTEDVDVERVFVTARQLAIMLQVSKRTLWRLRSAGKIPRPMRLGGVVRWKLDDILQWMAAGCPKMA
jgi:prophage regulatory protein